MASKLVQGDKLPPITLNLTDGTKLVLPEQMQGRYLALLFYRGNWCPYCMRHLAGYQAKLQELAGLEAHVVAATADTKETTMAAIEKFGLTFPVAYGVTESDLTAIDPWWMTDHHGRWIQPAEFLLLRTGIVFGSMYASGPVGRMDVEEVLNSIRTRERRRLEQPSR